MKYSTKNPKPLPSLEYLKECFDYNSETGVLTWRVRPFDHFSKGSTAKMWNSKNSGEVAGSLNQGYFKVSLDGIKYQVHRLCYYLGSGCEPHNIDHVNGYTRDNRLSNLMDVVHKDNMRNVAKRKDNKTGCVGLGRHKLTGRWYAELGNTQLGTYTDKIDAIYARYWAERDAGYHENHGRIYGT